MAAEKPKHAVGGVDVARGMEGAAPRARVFAIGWGKGREGSLEEAFHVIKRGRWCVTGMARCQSNLKKIGPRHHDRSLLLQ